jgi:hypothetical protein
VKHELVMFSAVFVKNPASSLCPVSRTARHSRRDTPLLRISAGVTGARPWLSNMLKDRVISLTPTEWSSSALSYGTSPDVTRWAERSFRSSVHCASDAGWYTPPPEAESAGKRALRSALTVGDAGCVESHDSTLKFLGTPAALGKKIGLILVSPVSGRLQRMLTIAVATEPEPCCASKAATSTCS